MAKLLETNLAGPRENCEIREEFSFANFLVLSMKLKKQHRSGWSDSSIVTKT